MFFFYAKENNLLAFVPYLYVLLDFQDEDDAVTWQTYKGQLTEKQEKTREKVIKRTQKASGPIFITYLTAMKFLL